eukprot:CAMPEP_0167796058 /NCGR_PEP_ID=MMETSP0111_2-20121227/14825_1 /TAXON_ID=91324 /ORGANISM="Lotharella globosa, Strain CCCM811" /LENGTH=640 /DNA_ID=CAMNT_0007689885 /DNA_START=14 /DNA_END=1939 /DNA_ORIENTATION=-
MFWAFSRLSTEGPPRLMSALQHQLASQAHDCNAQDVSNAIYSFAKLSQKPIEPLFDALRGRMTELGSKLKPQMISNLLWSFAKLEYVPTREENNIFKEQAEARMEDFTAQAVGNSLWAYATLALRPTRRLTNLLAKQGVKTIGDFTPQNLAYTYWSFAKLLIEPPAPFARAMQRRSLDTMHQFNPRACATLLWAFARIGRGLSNKLAHSLERRLDIFINDLKNYQPALSPIRNSVIVSPEIAGDLPLVAANLERGGGSGWVPPPPLFNEKGGYGLEGYSDAEDKRPSGALNSQDISNSLWALAVLGRTDCDLFYRLWDLTQSRLVWDSKELVQLYEVYNFVASDGGGHLLHWKHESTRRAAREECARVQAQELQTTSAFHNNVSQVLTDINIKFQNEGRIGTWTVDMHLTTPGLEHVVIEVDGPWHFLYNTSIPHGPTALKRKAIEDLGWTLVSIPFFEWGELNDNASGPGSKRQYLTDLILPHLSSSPAAKPPPRRSRPVIPATTRGSPSSPSVAPGGVAARKQAVSVGVGVSVGVAHREVEDIHENPEIPGIPDIPGISGISGIIPGGGGSIRYYPPAPEERRPGVSGEEESRGRSVGVGVGVGVREVSRRLVEEEEQPPPPQPQPSQDDEQYDYYDY